MMEGVGKDAQGGEARGGADEIWDGRESVTHCVEQMVVRLACSVLDMSCEEIERWWDR